MDPLYNIIRYFSDDRDQKRVKSNVTLEFAKHHCRSVEGRGVLQSGVSWKDGFTMTAQSYHELQARR